MNPTNDAVNASSVPTTGSNCGKKSLLNTSAAIVLYRKKSYHSTVVPTVLANATSRILLVPVADERTAMVSPSRLYRYGHFRPSPIILVLDALERDRRSLTPIAADRRQRVASAQRFQLVDGVQQDANPRHADRMPDRDRASPHVFARPIELEIANACQHLGRKRFVDLDEIELIDSHVEFREQLSSRRNRRDCVIVRVDRSDCAPDDPRFRFHAASFRGFGRRKHDRGSAIGQAARISGRDRPF